MIKVLAEEAEKPARKPRKKKQDSAVAVAESE